MRRISRLDDEVSVHLRSHVVINSVESVVRELVVNALEAHCTSIAIKVDLDTLSVCCEDNGRGISRVNLATLDKRNYSSKNPVSCAHRGEALSSIMECGANTVIESKVQGEQAGRFTMSKAGSLGDLASVLSGFFETIPISISGTAVMVTRLFSRSPVRYQYLKEGLKSNWIKRTLRPLLFELLHEHPSTKFELYVRSEGCFLKELSLEGKKDARILFHSMFEVPLGSLVPARESEDNLEAEGFVCVQSFRSYIYLFFHGRRVEVTRGRKKEISRIFRNYRVHSGRQGVVNKAITKGPVIYLNVRTSNFRGSKMDNTSTMFDLTKRSIVSVLTKLGYLPRNDTPPASQRMIKCSEVRVRDSNEYDRSSPICPNALAAVSMPDLAEGNFTLLKQILTLVILIKVNESLYAVDQHACDERIQLEGLLEEFIGNVLDPLCDLSIKCTSFVNFSVSSEDGNDFLRYAEAFLQCGIRYTVKDNIVYVTHLPLVMVNLMDPKALKQCLLQHIDDFKDRIKLRIREGESWFLEVKNVPTMIYEAFVSQACKLGIKFGDMLTAAEMKYLVVSLARCILPLQCAHGRPTIVEVDYRGPAIYTEDMDI